MLSLAQELAEITRLVEDDDRHLRDALGTRSVIGQAQGMLMHRHGYDTEAAFTALRTASQNHNTKLREVAPLVEAQIGEDLDPVLDRFGLLQPV